MEIIDIIKLYESDDSITKKGNTIVVESKNITAPQLALILASLNTDYEYVIKGATLLEIKQGQGITLESLAKKLDEKVENLEIKLTDDSIIIESVEDIKGLAKVAEELDNSKIIELYENKIIIKGE